MKMNEQFAQHRICPFEYIIPDSYRFNFASLGLFSEEEGDVRVTTERAWVDKIGVKKYNFLTKLCSQV